MEFLWYNNAVNGKRRWIMETYIDRIKAMKAEKKITNEQLAERTGIPLGTLSKILAGMSDSPKLANVISICRELDCSLEYIVSGTPENTNNYTLSQSEIRMIEDYRSLDRYGKELIDLVLEKESERSQLAAQTVQDTVEEDSKSARILRPASAKLRYLSTTPAYTGKRSIPLYELPVSAGVGVYLEEEETETIRIPNNEKTADADFVLRISGNSMEPKYSNGDYLLVKREESIEAGELGIFLLDGCGYFKVFGGDRLISLNEDYGDILLQGYSEVVCCGKVVGRLKKRG